MNYTGNERYSTRKFVIYKYGSDLGNRLSRVLSIPLQQHWKQVTKRQRNQTFITTANKKILWPKQTVELQQKLHCAIFYYENKSTERCSRAVKTPTSYLGGPGFKSRAGDRLPWLTTFVDFLCPSRQMSGEYLKLGHDHLNFLSNSSFVYHPFIRRYIMSY
jgi:hypothetical protein